MSRGRVSQPAHSNTVGFEYYDAALDEIDFYRGEVREQQRDLLRPAIAPTFRRQDQQRQEPE